MLTERLMMCTECPWKAETIQDQELVQDDGMVLDLAHVGCPECGGMLDYQPVQPTLDDLEVIADGSCTCVGEHDGNCAFAAKWVKS